MSFSEEVKIDSEVALAEFIRDLRKEWHEAKYLLIKVRTGKQRTLTQNAALHLFCQMLADELNASGLDMRKVMKPEIDIPWDGDSVKKNIWKPLQEALTGEISTSKASRVDYTLVYDVLAHHMATKLQVVIPEWPKKKE